MSSDKSLHSAKIPLMLAEVVMLIMVRTSTADSCSIILCSPVMVPLDQFCDACALQGGVPPQLGLCAKALANSRGNPLSRQWLFSAYVHRPPGAPPLQSLHAFYGHEVQGTAQVRGLSPITAKRSISYCRRSLPSMSLTSFVAVGLTQPPYTAF